MKREHKTSKQKYHVGDSTRIQDKNGTFLCIGDKIQYGQYTGRFLINHGRFCIALDYSKWYGDNEFTIDSYGKSIDIPADNGGKMSIELIEPINYNEERKVI